MLIRTLSIPVSDQSAALAFYTEKLGFLKKHDIPMGGDNRWLTVVSPEEVDGPEILLEPSPNHMEEVKVLQKALHAKGIPWTQLNVANMDDEVKRLSAVGVRFSAEPKTIDTAIYATIDDTCGNFIMLVQVL